MSDDSNAQGGAVNQGGTQDGGQSSLLTGQQNQQGGQPGAASTGVTDWRSSLPEQYRSNKVFENIKGKDLNEALPTLVKNYIEAQSYIGGAVKIPKNTDPPEKWNEFYKKVGRPEKSDDYQLSLGAINGQQLDETRLKGFLETAHKAGLTNKQVQDVLNFYTQDMNSTYEGHQQNQKVALEQLKEEWGPRFERKVVLAQRAVREYGGQAILDKLDSTGFGNDPDFVKFFADLGEVLVEDGFISGSIEGAPGPEQAKQKIQEVMSNPEHPYHAKFAGKPGHKEAVAEMQKLYQIAYPQGR